MIKTNYAPRGKIVSFNLFDIGLGAYLCTLRLRKSVNHQYYVSKKSTVAALLPSGVLRAFHFVAQPYCGQH